MFLGIVSEGLRPLLVTSVVGATDRDVLAQVPVRSLVHLPRFKLRDIGSHESGLEVADGMMLHTMALLSGPLAGSTDK